MCIRDRRFLLAAGLLLTLPQASVAWRAAMPGVATSIAEAAVDGPVYEAWRDSILQDGQPIEIPWLPLTRENIAALGYPEPEMSKPEDLFAG